MVQENAESIAVWCLLGKKAGDNTQVRALADELGCGYEEKYIQARPWELLVHLSAAASLGGIDRNKSSSLAPPWPDLVISAGRRNEPVARWIRQQSGGRTRLVHMGRPWAALSEWDLVVTTPQYFLPHDNNILHNSLPLHRLSRDQLSEDGDNLRAQIEALPRPWIAVLVGGDSGRFVLTPEKGKRLGELANLLAAGSGGSLLVTDSPRTPVAAMDELRRCLRVPNRCYRWGGGGTNPYRGLLAMADAFVVTGESMSMLGEAAAMGRPLYIFDIGDGERAWWRLAHSYRYKPLSHRLAMRFGPLRMRREIGNIQAALVESGRARWLEPETVAGEPQQITKSALADSPADPLATEELPRTAAAVRQLLTER